MEYGKAFSLYLEYKPFGSRCPSPPPQVPDPIGEPTALPRPSS